MIENQDEFFPWSFKKILKRIIVQTTLLKQSGRFNFNNLLSSEENSKRCCVIKNDPQIFDNNNNKWIVNNVASQKIGTAFELAYFVCDKRRRINNKVANILNNESKQKQNEDFCLTRRGDNNDEADEDGIPVLPIIAPFC